MLTFWEAGTGATERPSGGDEGGTDEAAGDRRRSHVDSGPEIAETAVAGQKARIEYQISGMTAEATRCLLSAMRPDEEFPMTTPTFHHVNLKTTRLDEMIVWYGQVAGLKVNHKAAVGAWLTNDAANHRLALLVMPGLTDDPAKDAHAGLHHTAFEFASFGDLYENFVRLRAIGIRPQLCLDHGMTTSMYYADPDKNLVELQVDNFGDWEKSAEWMRTSPEFAANPIGVFFDPDKVYDALRAGRTAADLHAAVMAGQFLPQPLPNVGPPA